MSETIEPALSAKQWAEALAPNARIMPNGRYEIHTAHSTIIELLDPTPLTRIALLNHILPADDPRKITREKIELIREAAGVLLAEFSHDRQSINDAETIRVFADALESYLPPP